MSVLGEKAVKIGTWLVCLAGLLVLSACAAAPQRETAVPSDTAAAAAAGQPAGIEEPCDCKLLEKASKAKLDAARVQPTAEPTARTVTPSPTATATPEPDETAPPAGYVTRTPTPTPEWMGLPVIPTISNTARQIYVRGLALGNRPNAFAKVGDCGVETRFFLTDFDGDPAHYDLGPYEDLRTTIEYFAGSFDRDSVAAKNGANTAGLFVPLWADREICGPDEGPLECEYRLWKPSIALIMVGTNDAGRPERFEESLRAVVDATIERGIVPVLATKADNLEGGHVINAAIARVAKDYDIPLWNFWAAVQPLPRHGLQPDGAHLTFLPNRFGDPNAMQTAWPVRNLTALQVLDALRQALVEDGS